MLKRTIPLLAVLAGLLVMGTGRASAQTLNLHDPIAVERYLLAHGPGILAQAAPALKAAIMATETRPGGMKVQTSYGLATTAAQRTQELTQVHATAAATVSCGWAYKKISYTPGLITYYSLFLQTNFCWNGYAIVGTPYQIHGGTASWGWSYTTRYTIENWFPYPTKFWSGVEADMRLGIYHNYPYINQYLYGRDWVVTTWNSEN